MTHYIVGYRDRTISDGCTWGHKRTHFGKVPVLMQHKGHASRYTPHEGFKQHAKATARQLNAEGKCAVRWQDVYAGRVKA